MSDDKKKEKKIGEMSAEELRAHLQEFATSQTEAPARPLPPGIAPDAKEKDIDRAVESLLRKPNELLTSDDAAFLRAESLRVLREGW